MDFEILNLWLAGSPCVSQQRPCDVHGGILWLSPGRSDPSAYRGTSYQKGNVDGTWRSHVGWKPSQAISLLTAFHSLQLLPEQLCTSKDLWEPFKWHLKREKRIDQSCAEQLERVNSPKQCSLHFLIANNLYRTDYSVDLPPE